MEPRVRKPSAKLREAMGELHAPRNLASVPAPAKQARTEPAQPAEPAREIAEAFDAALDPQDPLEPMEMEVERPDASAAAPHHKRAPKPVRCHCSRVACGSLPSILATRAVAGPRARACGACMQRARGL
jgi:hypothetical protein